MLERVRQSPVWSGVDWSDPKNASELQLKLQRYWAAKGFAIHTHIEILRQPKSPSGAREIACLRSDLLNGLPRNYKGTQTEKKAAQQRSPSLQIE